MRALLLAPLLLSAAAAAPAAETTRTVGLGTFERLRVEGPFEVTVATGSPGATITGERAAVDRIAIQADGATLVVRVAPGAGRDASGEGGGEPVRIALASPALRYVVSQGGARIRLAPLRARRIELVVSGAGAIALAGADADDVNAAVVGAGVMTLAGRTQHARLLVSGPGAIDADALEAGELDVIADGTGETRARARYGARVAYTGVGRVTVAGAPKCTLRPAGANVLCGTPR